MLSANGDIAGTLSRCAQAAANQVAEHHGDQADENSVTDQFLGAFAARIDLADTDSSSSIRAERVRDTGPNAVETYTGSDFVIKYKFERSDYVYKSGILVQAKHYDTYDDDIDSLREDCWLMELHTPSAFLVTYSPDGFYHFPASAIYGLERQGYDEFGDKNIYRKLPHRKTKAFYNRFFRGMIGDQIIYENWEYFLENQDYYAQRPVISDGGEEPVNPVEGGPGLEITVTVE